MTKKEFYYPSADGETQIHAIRWEPEGEPKAILQIIHGMVEYIDRYNDFATFLAEEGFLVTGEDHLGHGASVKSDEYHGYFGEKGNEWVIADIHKLRQMTHDEFPDTPYLMLGHSMGSFLIRQYITEDDASYADGLTGVIVMGTAWQPDAVMKFGKLLAKMRGLDDPNADASNIEKISFGSYLKRIDNPKTISDWITRDDEIVAKYRANPWCTFSFTPNAYYHMFDGMLKAHDKKRMQKLPAGLPILFCAGAEDPVGNYGEGVRKAFQEYVKNTECDVQLKIYDDDRHEILNELDKDKVYQDMLGFINYCLDKQSN